MSLTSFVLKMMTKAGEKVFREFDAITEDPMQSQRTLLAHILDTAKDSEYGKKYGFASISDVEEFQKRLPLTTYDDYAPYIERLAAGEQNLLTGAKTVHFNKTSGTVGVPKKIPVCEEQIKVFARYNAKMLNGLAARAFGTDFTRGKGLSLNEGKYEILPCGISYGSASALSSARMNFGPFKDMMGMLYTSPREARQPEKGTNTRYLHALYALSERNVTYGNATFSSFLLEIMRYIENNWEMLTDDIEHGTLNESVALPPDVRAALGKKRKPDPKRAEELRKIFREGFDKPFAPRVWPRLRYFICVGGASFTTYSEKLKERYFGEGIRFLFLGVSASEGYFSTPVAPDTTESVLAPDGMFLEFLPLDDEDVSHIKTMGELEVGGRYEIVVTNRSGFYRYRMRDAVEVTGKYHNTPTIRFLYRIDQTVSITGEKTTEIALGQAVSGAAAELGIDLVDYSLYPDVEAVPLRYVFLAEVARMPENVSREEFRAAIDRHLAVANPSMGEKIQKGICAPSELYLLQRETTLLYRDVQVLKGASAAQLKPVHIIRNEFQRRFFFGLREE